MHKGHVIAAIEPAHEPLERPRTVRLVDPVLLDLSSGRAAQRAKFGGELFPNVVEAQSGLAFSEFFQNERDGGRKGIVVIEIGDMA